MPKSINLIKYLIFAGIFTIPFLVFVVSGSMFFPFITGKNFGFRIIVEIIAALWLILMLFDSRYKPAKSWILFMFAAFVGIMAISSFFGENFYRSFWSNYERMEGLITYLHLLAYFLVLGAMVKTEKVWQWLLNATLLASAIISIYGLLQLMGALETHQGNRLDATLGNASYLAIYVVFHIFLALFLFYRSKTEIKWCYLGLAALESAVLYFTATRGAILGVVGGMFVSLILICVFASDRKTKMRYAALLVILIAIVASFWFLKNAAFMKNSPVLSRFASISFRETTTESRLTIWKMSWQGFKEKPLLGWGQENFNLVFNKYYEPVLYKQEPWFDRAHNVFFDRLTTNGIFGFLAYFGLLGTALHYLWIKRKESGFSAQESAMFTGMFLAYFFHNLFVFDNLISLILFVTFLAYVSFNSTKKSGQLVSESSFHFTYNRAMVGVIMGAGFLFVIYLANVPGILTSKTLIDALKVVNQGDAKKSFENFKKAIGYNSFGSMESREHLFGFATQVYNSQNLDKNFKEEVMTYAIEQLKKQNEDYPGDIREMIFLASLYNKAQKFDEAIGLLNQAIKISPKKQQLYFELGTSYLSKGEYEKGLETLKASFEFDPEFIEARKIYAVAAVFAGKESLAEELMKDYGGTITDGERFFGAYYQRKNYPKVIAILNLMIEKNPMNTQYRVLLAQIYMETKQRAKSVEQIQKAIEANPSFKQQGEEIIKEIKSGRNL